MITLTLQIYDKGMDLMVREDQRISEVLKVLKESQRIFFRTDTLLVYSLRKKEYVNQRLTFRQAEVFTGDVLILK